jgi:hypothetical protein
MALSKRLPQPPDRQLAGVKLPLLLNRRTVTVDPFRTLGGRHEHTGDQQWAANDGRQGVVKTTAA